MFPPIPHQNLCNDLEGVRLLIDCVACAERKDVVYKIRLHRIVTQRIPDMSGATERDTIARGYMREKEGNTTIRGLAVLYESPSRREL